MQAWSPLQQFDAANDKSNDSYLSTLTAFLAANPPGTLGAFAPSTQSLSSPEASDSSSPSSSEGNASAQPTPAPTQPAMAATAPATNDKRKTSENASKAALKDRRASAGNEVQVHTHAAEEDDEGSDEGKGGKGGKTSEKRRAQNRQAQRAFRERKEKHLKELEDRVFSLEQQTTDQGNENAALKQLLERLQSENERLKVYETAFSFSYAKDVNNSSAMPTSATFGGVDLTNVNKPPTPPTTQDDAPSLTSYNLAPFGLDSSLFPSPPATSSATPPAASAFTGSGLDSQLFFGSVSAPSPSSTAGESTGSSANVATPPDLNSDLFSTYRDSSSLGNFGVGGLDDFDSIFGVGSGSATTTVDEANALAAYLTSPSPPAGGIMDFASQNAKMSAVTTSSAPASSTTTTSAPASATSTPPALSSLASPPALCPYQTATTPGEKFSFDVDGLCSDLTAKAVCREAAKAALQAAMVEDAAAHEKLYPNKSPSPSAN
ncbi:hypothetical protein MNV49_005259 [Pseudohyphozyma bogoriensis]|nr:hypothetical protein MNV49_005259 [Pseudohyphozyma bogoriensis]